MPVIAGTVRSQDRDKTGTPTYENGPIGQNEREIQTENDPVRRGGQKITFCAHPFDRLTLFHPTPRFPGENARDRPIATSAAHGSGDLYHFSATRHGRRAPRTAVRPPRHHRRSPVGGAMSVA
jgi:hypothetical protein